jgi:hypothetical protein
VNYAIRLATALAILLVGTSLVLRSVLSADDRTAPRHTLIRAPLDDRALEALVRADDAAGRWAEEKRLIAVSTRLTKRNLPIRFMALASKAANGDLNAAIRDADLLLRQHAYQSPLYTFLRDASASPEGRAAIAWRLAGAPPWREDLLIRQRGLTPAGHGDAVALLTAMKTVTPPTDDEVESLAEAVVAAKDVDAAYALRAALAPPGGDLLIDGSFRRGNSSRSGLLGWRLGDGGEHDDIARQITFADPGRHILRWTTREGASPASMSEAWTLRCLQPTHLVAVGPVAIAADRGIVIHQRTIGIPDGCSAQIVALPRDASMSLRSPPTELRVQLNRSSNLINK